LIKAAGTGVALSCTNRTDRGDGATGDKPGTKQPSENKRHTHETPYSGRDSTHGHYFDQSDNNFPGEIYDAIAETGGNESRGINIYGAALIKIKS